jgi:predicted DNA-binding protein (MmcQ/YjbR family)
MNPEEVRDYFLSKKGANESLPFDDETLVFKVGGKMFGLLSLSGNNHINLKCDPERAISLREQHNAVMPGYHMNKQHWNTIDTQGGIPDKLLKELIDHSYSLIVDKLPKNERKKYT